MGGLKVILKLPKKTCPKKEKMGPFLKNNFLEGSLCNYPNNVGKFKKNHFYFHF